MMVAAIGAWAVFAGVAALLFVHWIAKREHTQRLKACREFLDEKGIAIGPDESVAGAIVRARPDSVSPQYPFARSGFEEREEPRATPYRSGFVQKSLSEAPTNRNGKPPGMVVVMTRQRKA